jgi:hypothetical protein
MIKAAVKNKQLGITTNASTHETQELAEAWVESNKWNFGKPDRWLEPSEFTDEDSSQSTDERLKYVDSDGNNVYEYFFPATYNVQFSDISAELAEEKIIADAEMDQANGRKVIAKIKAVNLRKQLDFSGLQALMSDQSLMMIRALLQDGSILTALAVLQGLQTDKYTSDEKEEVIDFIKGLGYGNQ